MKKKKEKMQIHSIFFFFPKNALTCYLPRGYSNPGFCRKGVSLPNDKILDWLKFKAFADNKIILTQKLKFVLARVEKIVGKGENAGYQHFLLFPPCF